MRTTMEEWRYQEMGIRKSASFISQHGHILFLFISLRNDNNSHGLDSGQNHWYSKNSLNTFQMQSDSHSQFARVTIWWTTSFLSGAASWTGCHVTERGYPRYCIYAVHVLYTHVYSVYLYISTYITAILWWDVLYPYYRRCFPSYILET